jgi:membrane associated rhomboid family serine protease
LLNIILANIPTTYRQIKQSWFSSIGASGAISGLLFMTILLNPWAMFQLFFIIPIPAVLLGAGYLVYSSMAAKKARDDWTIQLTLRVHLRAWR